MAQIWTMGELLCEIMRPEPDMPLGRAGPFVGPFPSGAPAIMIDAAARLGARGGIIGGVGRDDFGDLLLGRLTADGVDCSHVLRDATGATGVAFVTYFADGSRRFLYHFPHTPATRAKAPQGDVYGPDAAWFHVMGCSLAADSGFAREILHVMDTLLARGARVSFDPNLRPELLADPAFEADVARVMAAASVLMPGEAELMAVTGADNLAEAVQTCFQSPALEILALKRGARGCTVFTREERFSLGVYPLPVRDPTGAGDTFDGAFLCGLLAGKPLRETAAMASAAAALCAAALGPMEGGISPQSVAWVMARHTLVEGTGL